MRRFSLAVATALAALVLTANIALGAITFHSGPTIDWSTPTNGATATFNISGLGSEPARARLVMEGFATYTCRNKGGNAAPGQNPVPAQSTSPFVNLTPNDKNGRDTIEVTGTLTAPASVDPQVAGCPNGKWTANRDSLTVTGATLIIEQPFGNVIFSQFYDNPNN
jgi:hypothetical protein